jgi:hypothetical protein
MSGLWRRAELPFCDSYTTLFLANFCALHFSERTHSANYVNCVNTPRVHHIINRALCLLRRLRTWMRQQFHLAPIVPNIYQTKDP